MTNKIHPKHPSWQYVINVDPEKLAEVMGNLPYDELAAFIELLAGKLADDSVKDKEAGKPNLAKCLHSVSEHLKFAAFSTRAAWGICDPHMKKTEARCKVKAKDIEGFNKTKEHLKDAGIKVYVESEKRLMLSTDIIPSGIAIILSLIDVKVTMEDQYDIDDQ